MIVKYDRLTYEMKGQSSQVCAGISSWSTNKASDENGHLDVMAWNVDLNAISFTESGNKKVPPTGQGDECGHWDQKFRIKAIGLSCLDMQKDDSGTCPMLINSQSNVT